MKLYSFLRNNNNIIKTIPISSKQYFSPNPTPIKPTNRKLIPGVELGLPLNLFQFILTYLHFGYNIINPSLVTLQFLIGVYTYGKDRFNDALEAESLDLEFPKEKTDLYNYIINNKNYLQNIYDFTYYLILLLLSFNLHYDNIYNLESSSIIFSSTFLLLESTNYYKIFKESFGYLKGIYVGSMWTLSTVILPSILYTNNFDILYYPQHYLPLFFLIFSTSTLLDSKDIEEDKANNISTIPVIIGEKYSKLLCNISLSISSLILVNNEINQLNPQNNNYINFVLNLLIVFMNFSLIFNSS